MRNFLLLVLSNVLIIGCDIFDNEYIIQLSPVYAIVTTYKSTNSILFIAHAWWPNGCGTFDHSEVVKNGSNYSIKVFGKQKKYGYCTQQMITIDALVKIKNISPGINSFSFWESDTTFIDTSIVFNGL
jgi:hypothetical protein